MGAAAHDGGDEARQLAAALAGLKPAGGDVLSQAPRIAVSPRFLPPQICDWLIGLARPRLRRAELVDGITGQVREDPDRTNRAAEFSPDDPDVVLALVRSRIAAMANVTIPALD